jgi:glycosyltransferase involved in cell wall biosynthesis
MLNWRDQRHPASGGAELVTYRVLTRLARDYGWDVEWFSGAYPGAASQETADGILYVREGSQATVHLCAYRRYRNRRFDVVVDQTNTIPFFTPLYAKSPVTLFIHQLAREVWFYEAPAALRAIGYTMEPWLLRCYRNVPAITVSDSTSQSLRHIGLRGPVTVIPECVDDPGPPSEPIKSGANDVIVLGRLAPSKRIEESIRAAAELRRLGWNGTLHVVGGGKPEYLNHLKALAYDLHQKTVFHGKVNDDERGRLLDQSALLWMTSVREGWGLVVSEAGRHWTPAVVYDSPGLRDAVRNGETGMVVPPDARQLARAAKELLDDSGRLERYAQAARDFSHELTWEKTTRAFQQGLEVAMESSGASSAE